MWVSGRQTIGCLLEKRAADDFLTRPDSQDALPARAVPSPGPRQHGPGAHTGPFAAQFSLSCRAHTRPSTAIGGEREVIFSGQNGAEWLPPALLSETEPPRDDEACG